MTALHPEAYRTRLSKIAEVVVPATRKLSVEKFLAYLHLGGANSDSNSQDISLLPRPKSFILRLYTNWILAILS